MRRGRPESLFGPSGAAQRKAQDGCQNGQQWLAARREQLAIHLTSQCDMVLRTAACGLRTARPIKGAYDLRPANSGRLWRPSCVGAVPTGGPLRPVGHTPTRSMWHGFANCGLRPANSAPYKGRPRPTNLSGLLATSPMRGGLTTNELRTTMNDGATGPKTQRKE